MTTTQAPAPNPAAQWLIDRFEAANPGKILLDVYRRAVVIQPMIKLKSDGGPGKVMHVTRADYADPGRWWL